MCRVYWCSCDQEISSSYQTQRFVAVFHSIQTTSSVHPISITLLSSTFFISHPLCILSSSRGLILTMLQSTNYETPVHNFLHSPFTFFQIGPNTLINDCSWMWDTRCFDHFFFFRAHQLMHLSLRLIIQPLTLIQHRYNNPVPLIKRQRSLTEAVLGSTVSLPKML